jgi:hypothetical protein
VNDKSSSDSPRLSTEAAAQLLQASDIVDDRVREAIAARTQAIIDVWMAAAVVAYALAFAFSSVGGAAGAGLIPGGESTTGNGVSVAFLVLAAFLATSALTDGLTQSLRQPTGPGAKLRRGYATASLLPFVAIAYLAFLAPTATWPLALVIVAVAAAPVVVLAIRSARRAKLAGVRRPEPALSALLDPSGRVATAILGLWLGAIGMLTAPMFGIAGLLAACAFLLVLLATRTTRFGLDRLGEDWGRTQWTAFGCSYLLALALSVVLARTTWNPGVVGVVGGILIAAPMVFAAFRPAPIWEA